jgi:hypothetical protein
MYGEVSPVLIVGRALSSDSGLSWDLEGDYGLPVASIRGGGIAICPGSAIKPVTGKVP